MAPFISIIVPVYKSEDTLRHCVDSILRQPYDDFELLLIDDGSPDQSGNICDEYAAKEPRIRVFHKENGGVSAARNLGLEVACGEWITFIDADDSIDDGFFNLPKENAGFDLIIGGIQEVPQRGHLLQLRRRVRRRDNERVHCPPPVERLRLGKVLQGIHLAGTPHQVPHRPRCLRRSPVQPGLRAGVQQHPSGAGLPVSLHGPARQTDTGKVRAHAGRDKENLCLGRRPVGETEPQVPLLAAALHLRLHRALPAGTHHQDGQRRRAFTSSTRN